MIRITTPTKPRIMIVCVDNWVDCADFAREGFRGFVAWSGLDLIICAAA
ncbi:hypothetical protein J4226_03475 [Candidatus Pacearchaeota archaeon]|nr:hypothetical protein [Candidatus Pacearchaeota archaeon]